jgi:AcrR family transcriptional regulator
MAYMDEKFLLDHENAERILEEGWRMFQQKGYRGVTVDELCQRCGITKPTLYYYFEDKENLFVQVLQHRLRGFHKEVERPGTLGERLQYVAANILESFQMEYSALLRDREHLKKPENLSQIREAFREELFGPLYNLMQAGIDQGELRPENPEVLTLIYLGMVNNFIGKAAELGTDHAALARRLTDYFLYGAQKNASH